MSGFGLLGHLAEMLDASGVARSWTSTRCRSTTASTISSSRASTPAACAPTATTSARASQWRACAAVSRAASSRTSPPTYASRARSKKEGRERPDLGDPANSAGSSTPSPRGRPIAVSPERLLALFEALTAGDVEADHRRAERRGWPHDHRLRAPRPVGAAVVSLIRPCQPSIEWVKADKTGAPRVFHACSPPPSRVRYSSER